EVDALDLYSGRLPVQEVVELFFAVRTDWLVRVDEARLGEDTRGPPAIDLVAGDGNRALGDRPGVVKELREVDVGHRATAFTARTHAASERIGPSDGLAATAFDGHRTAR